jgi:hypothetical protein
MRRQNEAPGEHAQPSDGELLDGLLDYLDTFNGVLSAIHDALENGETVVRLRPRAKGTPIIKALDSASLDLTRHTIQVRAQRALRDGLPDETLEEVLDELGNEATPEQS